MKTKHWLIAGILAIVVFALGLLTNSVLERKAESQAIARPTVNNDLGDLEARNEMWAKYYPRQYDTWTQTKDTTFRSKYMSSDNDDMLEQRPEMVVLWAGYAFSKEYTAPRGHMHAIEDVAFTLRTGAAGVPDASVHSNQPGTCWTCKSPDVPRLMKEVGIENYYKAHFDDWGSQIVNPIGCNNCHDPKTMNLTIMQPALVEAFNRQGKDISKATHQEMRSLVCAQCHVEYHFKKEGSYLNFPWDGGMTVEKIEEYYDNAGWTDYVHTVSKTPILKAQHPDYEISQLGIHGQRGVSCADCHMPYKSEGGVKYSDHRIVSPLANMNNTCQVCHRESEDKLRQNVYERQDHVFKLRNRLEKALAYDHFYAKYLWDNGATEEQMKPVLALIRKSQWRWDYITASHGSAFHAPIEALRVLSDGLDYAQQAETMMANLTKQINIATAFVMPDISTKAKAQKIIGLDMEKEEANKKQFIKNVYPQWVKEAKEKGRLVTAK